METNKNSVKRQKQQDLDKPSRLKIMVTKLQYKPLQEFNASLALTANAET